MTNAITIQPVAPFRVSLRPPGSKSLTNRALLLAALADGESRLTGPLLADDSRQMFQAMTGLGFDVRLADDASEVRVIGQAGGIAATQAKLHLGNAGTAYRFLTATCLLGHGVYELDGIPRMRQRPIGQLVDPLRKLGGKIEYLGQEGFPPLRVTGHGSLPGGQLTLEPTLSSQYISALLQIAPCMEQGLILNFRGPVTSRPYVEMTLAMMKHFGVSCDVDAAFQRIAIPAQAYQTRDYAIEPDASNASYFLAAAAVVPGAQCTIQGLGKRSLQGDIGVADLLHQMGAGLVFGDDSVTILAPAHGQRLHGIDVDLNAMPDMAQTLAVVALFADGPTTLRNIGNLRVKETDRLAALKNELTKLGACVTIDGDDLTITPAPNRQLTPAAINTYDDHRMAMAFAVAGLASPGVTINDPACVNKTFPGFFDYLSRLRSGSMQ